MCLAIPGKIIDTYQQQGLAMAKVSFDGVVRSVCLQYTPEAHTGQYVLVHVGFAISIIHEKEAQESMQILRSMGELESLRN